MEENNGLVLTDRQQLGDQVVVTVLSGLAGIGVSKLVEKGYRLAITSYRLKKAAA